MKTGVTTRLHNWIVYAIQLRGFGRQLSIHVYHARIRPTALCAHSLQPHPMVSPSAARAKVESQKNLYGPNTICATTATHAVPK